MPDRFNISPEPVEQPIDLASGAGLVTITNTWKTLVSRKTPANGVSYLEKLAYYGQTAGSSLMFALFINGAPVADSFFWRSSAYGEIGKPQPIPRPKELPAAATIEIRVFDTDPTANIGVECDGEINTYAKRLP